MHAWSMSQSTGQKNGTREPNASPGVLLCGVCCCTCMLPADHQAVPVFLTLLSSALSQNKAPFFKGYKAACRERLSLLGSRPCFMSSGATAAAFNTWYFLIFDMKPAGAMFQNPYT